MSLLINASGRCKTYAVVDTHAKSIVAAFNWFQEANKALKALPGDNLELHNITHPKCPDWLQALVKADKEYCEGRAKMFNAEAALFRRKAAEHVAQAEEYERRAAEWRATSDGKTERQDS